MRFSDRCGRHAAVGGAKRCFKMQSRRETAMMRKVSGLALGCVLLSAALSAAAQGTVVPARAKLAIDAARKACRQANGLRLTVKPEAVRGIDLTGDGRPDFIVDFEQVECERRENIFCGTGGCDLAIVVALGGGKFRQVFRQHVLRYAIEDGEGARTIRFDLHGAYCGKTGPEPCAKRQRITAKAFRFKAP
jgi:hypothetical protein